MTHTQNSLEVNRQIAARRDKVFEAWTRRELMDWYCPEDMKLVSAEADVKVGGQFRASMQGTDGNVRTFYGTYQELVSNRRLVFTHYWEVGPWETGLPVETRVTVRFEDKGGATLVTVVQEGFADRMEAKGHEDGWASTLRNLEKWFLKPPPKAPHPPTR